MTSMPDTPLSESDAPASPLPPSQEGDRMVLVGTRYGSGMRSTWNEWDGSTFAEACAKVAEKHEDRKANVYPSEVVEVVVVRRALVKATIAVQEVTENIGDAGAPDTTADGPGKK